MRAEKNDIALPRARRALRVVTQRGPDFRETLAQWRAAASTETPSTTKVTVGVVAALLHLVVMYGLFLVPKSESEVARTGASGKTAHVRIQPPPAVSVPVPVPQLSKPPVRDNQRRIAVSQAKSAVKIPEKFAAPVVQPTTAPALETTTPVTPRELPESKISEPVTASGVSRNLRNLLPSSNATYNDRQREIGQIVGEGPVGGDSDAVNSQDGTTSGDYDPMEAGKPKARYESKSFDYAAYYDSLNRRFNDAWGHERTLGANAFVGAVGEVIQYDIVINRDGSLRKIVNVSAVQEPMRDYSAVDKLVLEVFQGTFPLNPIPDRITKDPMVLRKSIRYAGVKARIF